MTLILIFLFLSGCIHSTCLKEKQSLLVQIHTLEETVVQQKKEYDDMVTVCTEWVESLINCDNYTSECKRKLELLNPEI